jgi:ribosomal subunit interface protein
MWKTTPMQLIISGRGVVLTREFKDSVTEKIAKLGPLLPALVEARATFTAEKFRRTVRLTLTARRRVFSSTATAGDLGAAVDEAVAGLAHQVRRAKDRRRLAPRRLTRAIRRRPADEVA